MFSPRLSNFIIDAIKTAASLCVIGALSMIGTNANGGQTPQSRTEPNQNRPVDQRKPPPTNDPAKSTYVLRPQNPQAQTPPVQTEPPQMPPLQLTFSPEHPRIGEAVTFTLKQATDLTRRLSFRIKFDDGSEEAIALNGPGTSHRFSEDRLYKVQVSGSFGARAIGVPSIETTTEVQVERWSFTASPSSAELGEPVTFNIENPSADPAIKYLFHFGESTAARPFSADANAVYRYHSAATFNPFVEVQTVDRSLTSTTEKKEIIVRPLQPGALKLDAEPTSLQTGKEVLFTATLKSQFEAEDASIAFRFSFDDGITSAPQRDRIARHAYSEARVFNPAVILGWFDPQSREFREIIRASSLPVTVTGQAPANVAPSSGAGNERGTRDNRGDEWPAYIVYILAGLVLVGAGLLYASYRTWRGQTTATPMYVAYFDEGRSETEGYGLRLNFEVEISSNTEDATYSCDDNGRSLIRFERITYE